MILRSGLYEAKSCIGVLGRCGPQEIEVRLRRSLTLAFREGADRIGDFLS